ncbi:hypothetical protein [Bacillus paranthracis]|uniref:hypothetical protein n=1 Tax=Bacillus paranthracis TaxID=2026186 RepID=UPI002D79C2A9|nr:hypothetical protein [Bacillus paranthracis]
MNKFKKIAIYVVAGIAVLFIGSAIGSSGAKATIDKKQVSIADLDKEIKSKEAELNKQKDKNKEVLDIIAHKDKLVADTEKAQKQLDDKNKAVSVAQGELDKISAKLKEKEDKLDAVTVGLIKAEGEPKTLGSGEYVVGKDVPAGRYKATPVGQGSNFVVYDRDGIAVVNTILGSSDTGGTGDYTFFCKDGNRIETHAPVKLVPVK